ncbi:hypothetical protein BGZ60DRAFT_414105 [Tricladium varicosporioides]|nr:hypothetical protein BGZ60DRAFT_414105 [Hymenoscyphus varicosporioides]
MSPSRGNPETDISSTETQANLRSSSALASAKRNIQFLFSPDSPTSPRPARLRTRALLRSVRYISIFVFWRIVRYAKYALVGSVLAAVGATAFGGVISGVGFVLAPPTLLTSVGFGILWAAGKWGFRKLRVGEMGVQEVKESHKGVRRDGQWRDVQGPRAVPW